MMRMQQGKLKAERPLRLWLLAALAALAFVLAPRSAAAQGEPDAGVQASAEYEDTDPSALTEFRDTLAPHGTWISDPTYGTVWVPNVVVVGQDFRPYYTAGHWAVADDGGWMWVSDYDWGYVPFHYGRWVWIPDRGWAWIPGRRYAHAWVEWRVGEPGWDYVGWAPMGPSFIWVDGYAVGYWGVGVLPWWFVPSYWLFHPAWHMHAIHDSHRIHEIAGHTHSHHGGGGSGHHAADARPAGGDHSPASPTSASGTREAGRLGERPSASRERPSSPSFDEARIPGPARPKGKIAPDARASALAKPPAGYRPPSHTRPASERLSPAAHGQLRGAGAVRASRNPEALRNQLSPPAGRPGTASRATPERMNNAWRPPQRPSENPGLRSPASAPRPQPWTSRPAPGPAGSSTWHAPASRPSYHSPAPSVRKSSAKPASRPSVRKSGGGSRSHFHKR